MSHTERALIARAQEGDIPSFEALIQPHQGRLFRMILAVTASREDAEDCLQEAMLNAYRALPAFRGDAAFATWLYRVALNTTRNWLRAEARASTLRIAARISGYPEQLASSPEKEVFTADTIRGIRAALAGLPDHYREPILLRHYRDMSYDEIASVLAIPVGTVRSRLAQGRRLLSERLEALGVSADIGEGAIP